MNHYSVCRAAPTLPESAYYPGCAVNTLLRIPNLFSMNQPPQQSGGHGPTKTSRALGFLLFIWIRHLQVEI